MLSLRGISALNVHVTYLWKYTPVILRNVQTWSQDRYRVWPYVCTVSWYEEA
jgi:hypothetical protein